MLKQPLSRGIVFGAFAAAMILPNAAFAFAPETDLLEIKGYSPETIQVADKQRSKQEWRAPAKDTQGPVARFFHNVYYNEWTGSIDPFGSAVIRSHP